MMGEEESGGERSFIPQTSFGQKIEQALNKQGKRRKRRREDNSKKERERITATEAPSFPSCFYSLFCSFFSSVACLQFLSTRQVDGVTTADKGAPVRLPSDLPVML